MSLPKPDLRKQIFHVDMDGVLVDFISGALRAHGMEGLVNHNPDVYEDMGISKTQFWAKLQGHEFWRDLEWMEDGELIWRQLLLSCEPQQVVLLTSPAPVAGCMEGKRLWVQRHMPDHLATLTLTRFKAQVAAPGRMLIDDSDRNCDEYRDAGGLAILVPRTWNSGRDFARSAYSVFRDGLGEQYRRMIKYGKSS